MQAIDTHTVTNRRVLKLTSLEELEAEAERIIAAAQEHRLVALGNWSVGQILQHVARTMEFSMFGFPYRYPWYVRLAGRVGRLVNGRDLPGREFRPGSKIPSLAVCLEPNSVMHIDHAAKHIRKVFEVLHGGQEMTHPSPLDGPLTHDQWVQIHLRHAEHHFGFLHIKEV